MSVTRAPLTTNIGVEITGISGHELLDRESADDCLGTLERYGVVVYREVGITDEDLIAFSRRLGEVAVVPTGEHVYPEIQTMTLDPSKTNALLASYRQGNFLWHIDGATQEAPQKSNDVVAKHRTKEVPHASTHQIRRVSRSLCRLVCPRVDRRRDPADEDAH